MNTLAKIEIHSKQWCLYYNKAKALCVELSKGYDPLEIQGEVNVEGLNVEQRDTGVLHDIFATEKGPATTT